MQSTKRGANKITITKIDGEFTDAKLKFEYLIRKGLKFESFVSQKDRIPI